MIPVCLCGGKKTPRCSEYLEVHLFIVSSAQISHNTEFWEGTP